jgi:hypothetical protein
VLVVADHIADAIDAHELARDGVVVLGGGMAQRYPRIGERIFERLSGRDVESTLAPAEAKSAAAWGLRYALIGAEAVYR